MRTYTLENVMHQFIVDTTDDNGVEMTLEQLEGRFKVIGKVMIGLLMEIIEEKKCKEYEKIEDLEIDIQDFKKDYDNISPSSDVMDEKDEKVEKPTWMTLDQFSKLQNALLDYVQQFK